MADFDLNLSTQPFPAYRLVTIALICVLVALVGVSFWQVDGFIRYSKMVRSIRPQEQDRRVAAEALAKRVSELESRLDRPESMAKLNEIGFLNHLIVQKNLSWTKLFGVLEELVPDNVHLTNLTPDISPNGTVMLRLGVRARSVPDIKQFLERVEQSPLFENVKVAFKEKLDQPLSTDVDVTMSAIYYPQGKR